MRRYVQGFLHQIYPKVFEAPPRITLTEEETKGITDNLDQKSSTTSKHYTLAAIDSAFNIAKASLMGISFALGQEFLARNEKEKYGGVSEAFDDNTDLVLWASAVGIASFVLSKTRSQIVGKFFKEESIAESIRGSLSSLTQAQLEEAQRICAEGGDLSQIMSPKPNILTNLTFGYAAELPFLVAGVVAQTAPVADKDKYLVFTATKCLAAFALQKMYQGAARISDSQPLFSPEFLSDFSEEEQNNLREFLTRDLAKHRGHSEEIKNFIIGAAISFAFVGTVHNQALPTNDETSLQQNVIANAANFAIGSTAANSVRLLVKALRETGEKIKRSQTVTPQNLNAVEEGELDQPIENGVSAAEIPLSVFRPESSSSRSSEGISAAPQSQNASAVRDL